MHGLAVVAQRRLGEAFRAAGHLGKFGPCVTVAVERDALNAKLATALAKLLGAVPYPHAGQVREQHTLGGQVIQKLLTGVLTKGKNREHGRLPLENQFVFRAF